MCQVIASSVTMLSMKEFRIQYIKYSSYRLVKSEELIRFAIHNAAFNAILELLRVADIFTLSYSVWQQCGKLHHKLHCVLFKFPSPVGNIGFYWVIMGLLGNIGFLPQLTFFVLTENLISEDGNIWVKKLE